MIKTEGAWVTTAPPSLEPFVGQWAVLLITYKRDGTPIGTPVNIAVDGDRAFVRTFDTAWKLKRIRNHPEVEVAPSTWRGRPTGPAIRARARVLEGEEAAYAGRLLARKHPILHRYLVPLVHRLRGDETVHIGLRPLDSGPGSGSRKDTSAMSEDARPHVVAGHTAVGDTLAVS